MLAIIILASFFEVIAQPVLQKTWISEDLTYLKIDSTEAYYSSSSILDKYYCVWNDSVLHLWKYQLRAFDSVKQQNDYYLKIIELSEDSLIISPVSENAKYLVNDRPKLTFVNFKHIYDSNLVFKCLTFSAEGCFGKCPVVKLFFDSSGRVIFLGENFTEPYVGLYEGKIPKQLLQDFIEILKRSAIEKTSKNTGIAIDLPYYFLKISYNNKVKTIEGSNFSYFQWTLFNFLSNLYTKLHLKKRLNSYEFDIK